MTGRTDIIAVALNTISVLQRRCPKLGIDSLMLFLHVGQMEGCSVKELAYRCRMSECRVSRALKGLQTTENGPSLVRMLQHADDRRCVRVMLSDAGAALLEEVGAFPPRSLASHANRHQGSSHAPQIRAGAAP